MTTSGRPSWLDRAVHEALTVCPAAVPWEVRLMAIAMAPTIQAEAKAEAAREFESGNEWCRRALEAEAAIAAIRSLCDDERHSYLTLVAHLRALTASVP